MNSQPSIVKTLAVVQARMSSTRFPGKVLADLHGKPMVIQQLERISQASSLDRIVVATSTDLSDDHLVEVLSDYGYETVRGALDDVLERFVIAVNTYDPEVVVRLTADCPLTSPKVIDDVVNAFHASHADYLSNTMTPTYPDGLDVEVVKAEVLREVARVSVDQPEREHVTLGVYRQANKYVIENFAQSEDMSDLRWTVDSPEDFAFVQKIYSELFPANPNFDLPDILRLLEAHPELSRTQADAPRNVALQGLDTGAMNVNG